MATRSDFNFFTNPFNDPNLYLWFDSDGEVNEGETDSQDKIKKKCDQIKELLLEKNRKYGDAALSPVRIFSKADPAEQLRVRIDDKLSRIANGALDEDEDPLLDLIGYLILLKISMDGQ